MKKVNKVENDKYWNMFFNVGFGMFGILGYTMSLHFTKDFLKWQISLVSGLVVITQITLAYARALKGKEKVEVLKSFTALCLTLLIVVGNMLLNFGIIADRLHEVFWPSLFTEILLSSLSGVFCFQACRLFITGMEKLTISLWKRYEKFPLLF